MPWKCTNVIRKGKDVFLTLTNDEDPENILTEILTYGFDPTQGLTPAQFKTMVKKEIILRLNILNSSEQEEDLTQEFCPTP